MSLFDAPTAHRRFRVEAEEDVGELRRAVRAMAAGLPGLREGEAELVATELAANIVRHTPGGYVLTRPADGGVELIAVDRGRGLPPAALQDSADPAGRAVVGAAAWPTSAGGLGVGLSAVRRRARLFDAHSDLDGTVILVRIGPAPPAPAGPWCWGGVDIPLAGEGPSGDAWAVAPADRGLAALVVDGLGHGPDAAAAARAAVVEFERRTESSVAEYATQAHQAMRRTRGGVLGACRIDTVAGSLVFVGVGNVAGRIQSGAKGTHLVSHPGTLGIEASVPRVRPETHPWPVGGTLLLASDGIDTHWDPAARPGLLRRHPAVIAAVLHRDHARGRDDATMLVVRDTRLPGSDQEDT